MDYWSHTVTHIILIIFWLYPMCVDSVSGGIKIHSLGYNTTQLLNQLLTEYDKRLRPDFGGPPLLVDVNMNIRSMGPVSEIDMAYQMDCYFRQSWVDRRLRFEGSMKTLTVSINLLDRMWKPDTHFLNGKRSYLHTVTSPNKLLRIDQDGRILYSMRLTIKASCPMHLQKFPMDTQSCPLTIASHGYNVEDVQYKWTHGKHHSIKMSPDMRLSQFDLMGFPHDLSNNTYPGGVFTVLYANFIMKRHTGYFLINVYVPCALLVVLSWVAFWINREATSDRIALGVTVVLTMAFLSIDNRTDLPKVSYSTAVDYYLGICFAFVLATIIQFAAVHFFTKHNSGEDFPDSDEEDERPQPVTSRGSSRFSQTTTSSSYGMQDTATSNGMRQIYPQYVQSPRDGNTIDLTRFTPRLDEESCLSRFWHCLRGSAKYRDMKRMSSTSTTNSESRIDILSRIFFPVLFILFNIVYWSFYTTDDDDGRFVRLKDGS